MNQRVSARHFRRFQYDRVGGGSSERTTALDRMAFAIGRFQPGTFLLGRVHTETFYQKVMGDAKYLIWRDELRRARADPKRRRGAAASRVKLSFLLSHGYFIKVT